MYKKVIERLDKEIRSVDDLINHLKKKQERYLPEYRKLEFKNGEVIVKNSEDEESWIFDRDFLKKVYELIRIYIEMGKYVYQLKTGDKIKIKSSSDITEAIVKRINRTKDKEINSITVEVIYPSGEKSNYQINIKEPDSLLNICYKDVSLHDIEYVLNEFLHYLSLLSKFPKDIQYKIEKLYKTLILTS